MIKKQRDQSGGSVTTKDTVSSVVDSIEMSDQPAASFDDSMVKIVEGMMAMNSSKKETEVCEARPITPTIDAVMFGSWADDDEEVENAPMDMDNGVLITEENISEREADITEMGSVLDESRIEEGEIENRTASPTQDSIGMNVSMECSETMVHPEEGNSGEKNTAESNDADRGRSRSIPNKKKKQRESSPLDRKNYGVRKRKAGESSPVAVKVDANRNERSSRSSPRDERRPSSASSSIRSPRKRFIPNRRRGNSDRPRPRFGVSNSSRGARFSVRDGDQRRHRGPFPSSSSSVSRYSTPRSISNPSRRANSPVRHAGGGDGRRDRRESPSRSASNRSRRERSPVRNEDRRDKRRASPCSSRISSPHFATPRSVSNPSKAVKSSDAEKKIAKPDGKSHKSIPKKEGGATPLSSAKSAKQSLPSLFSKMVENPIKMSISPVVNEDEEIIQERRKKLELCFSFDDDNNSPEKAQPTKTGRYCSLPTTVSAKTDDRTSMDGGKDDESCLPHPDQLVQKIKEEIPSLHCLPLSGEDKETELAGSSARALFSQEKSSGVNSISYDLSHLNRGDTVEKRKEEVKSNEVPTLPLRDPRLKRRSSPIRPSYDGWGQSTVGSPSIVIVNTQPKKAQPTMRRRSDGTVPVVPRPSPVSQHSFMQAPDVVCLDVPEAKAKPLTDPLSLCFTLKFNTDYEDIINCYERLHSSVTVCRSPSIGRDGIAMLRFIDRTEAKIMLERGERLTFEHGRIKLHRPALITFNVTTNEFDSDKWEEEVEREIGAIAEYFYDEKKREGWICFAKETHASNLLKMRKFVCKSQEVNVYINGFDEIREQGKELRLREDKKWPAHRKKMKAARLRALELQSKNGETDWKSPAMQQYIRNQMDDRGNVTLIGAAIFFEDYSDSTIVHLEDYFRDLGGYARPMDIPQSSDNDPGSITISVPVQVRGHAIQTDFLIDILRRDHTIKGSDGREFEIYVGIPTPIEIEISPPLDIRHQRMLVRDFQEAFGAVSGFRLLNPEKIEGPSKYRLTFMHMENASRAQLVLPVFLHEPFLRGNKKYILSGVSPAKNCQ